VIAQIFTPRHGLLALAFAVAGWLLAPAAVLNTGQLVRAQRDDWTMVDTLRRPSLSATVVEVAAAGIWGVQSKNPSTPAAGVPAEDVRWRVAGLYGRGDERRALVVFSSSSKSPQYLKVGDVLPTGQKITSIRGNEICVQIGKRAYRFPVQRSEP
jgi:hypothetical protein